MDIAIGKAQEQQAPSAPPASASYSGIHHIHSWRRRDTGVWEVDGSTVVACEETAEVLELAEASLDAVAGSISFDVVPDQDFA